MNIIWQTEKAIHWFVSPKILLTLSLMAVFFVLLATRCSELLLTGFFGVYVLIYLLETFLLDFSAQQGSQNDIQPQKGKSIP